MTPLADRVSPLDEAQGWRMFEKVRCSSHQHDFGAQILDEYFGQILDQQSPQIARAAR